MTLFTEICYVRSRNEEFLKNFVSQIQDRDQYGAEGGGQRRDAPLRGAARKPGHPAHYLQMCVFQ